MKHVVIQAVVLLIYFWCRMCVSIIQATYARTDEHTMQNMRNPTQFAYLFLFCQI